MNVLGLKIRGHDTGAALIAHGHVTAIAEERLDRIKHSPNIFPHLAIDYCLKHLKIEPRELDLIVIDQIDQVPTLKIFYRETGDRFSSVKTEVINHHAAHAANAFFCSPFQEAAIMIYDGSGEKFSTHFGVPATETETLFYGQNHGLTEISKSLHVRFGKHFIFTSGIGRLYSFITQYLGFGAYEEGKTMGLAPYGNPSLFKIFPEEVWYREWRGGFCCNTKIRYPSTLAFWNRWLKGKIYQGMQFLNNTLPKGRSFLLNFGSVKKWFLQDPGWFPVVRLPRPMRDRNVSLPDDHYTHFAYLVQAILEKILVGWAKRARAITRSKYLCISGGLGLNSVSNKKILDEAGFEDVWIQPACSDTGLALGLALYGYHVILDQPRFWTMNHAYMGRSYTDRECREAMEKFQDQIVIEQPTSIVDATAQLLKDGKIIGWFQGGSEYGPRALGHRSMLGNACVPDMKDVMNRRVKHREWWRPFATSVLEEHVSDYFEIDRPSPFMLMVAPVYQEQQAKIPSIVHVDGTCRIQTVNQADNGIYYDLIKRFYEMTGIPLILNTSFNLAGEPIIETPEDALKDFVATDLDCLVIEKYLIRKK